MAKTFDVAFKDLFEADLPSLAPLAGYPISSTVEAIDSDLSTVISSADKVLKIHDVDPWLLQFEFQASYLAYADERIQWYNTLLKHRHRLRVRSVMVLLRPEADSPRWTGVYEDSFPGEAPYTTFRYRVIRLWQMPVATFLEGGIGLLPLAPLADIRESDLPDVIDGMKSRLAETPATVRTEELWRHFSPISTVQS